MNKTAKTHLAAINAGQVERTNIIGLRKLINASERKAQGWSIGVTASHVTLDELDIIETVIADKLPLVSGTLAETGIALLQNKRYARQLTLVSDYLPSVARFRLARFDRVGWHRCHCVPVYRVYDSCDAFLFTFRNIPWQSGGNGPEIIGA